MKLDLGRRSAVIALGVGGALSLGAAAALASTAHTATPTHMPAGSMDATSMGGTSTPTSTTARTTPSPTATSSPTSSSPSATATRQLSVAQAVALASRQMHARVEKVEMKVGATGVDYKVDLVRPDGSDFDVLVVGRTGRVLTEAQQEQLEAVHPDSDAGTS